MSPCELDRRLVLPRFLARQFDYTASDGGAVTNAGDAGLTVVSYKHMHYECLIGSRGRPIQIYCFARLSLFLLYGRATLFKGFVAARIVIYPLSL